MSPILLWKESQKTTKKIVNFSENFLLTIKIVIPLF